MRRSPRTRWAVAAGIPLVLGLVGMGMGSSAALAAPSPTPTANAPVSVVIPGASSPSPSTSGSPGTGGGSTGGGSNGGGSTGGGSAPAPANPDGSPVPPAQPAEDAPRLKLDKKRLQAGEWIVATASGYQPGEKAQVVLYPGAVVIASYTVGADGTFTARFRIPEGTRTGAAVLEVTGWTSGYVANGKLAIVAGAPASDSWLSLWWVYIVVGALGLAVLWLAIAFRHTIATLFGTAATGTQA